MHVFFPHGLDSAVLGGHGILANFQLFYNRTKPVAGFLFAHRSDQLANRDVLHC